MKRKKNITIVLIEADSAYSNILKFINLIHDPNQYGVENLNIVGVL